MVGGCDAKGKRTRRGVTLDVQTDEGRGDELSALQGAVKLFHSIARWSRITVKKEKDTLAAKDGLASSRNRGVQDHAKLVAAAVLSYG